jgi:hypothetical protein
MAVGFEIYREAIGLRDTLTVTVATGTALAIGEAVVFSASQAGSVEPAVDGSVKIAGVATVAVASSASGTPTTEIYDPRHVFIVNRKAAQTAGTTAVGLECDLENATSIDHSDAAANKPVLVLGVKSTGAAGESIVTFTDTIYGNRA